MSRDPKREREREGIRRHPGAGNTPTLACMMQASRSHTGHGVGASYKPVSRVVPEQGATPPAGDTATAASRTRGAFRLTSVRRWAWVSRSGLLGAYRPLIGLLEIIDNHREKHQQNEKHQKLQNCIKFKNLSEHQNNQEQSNKSLNTIFLSAISF